MSFSSSPCCRFASCRDSGLTDKDRLKQIHFSIHLFSLVLICIGLAATFDFHTHEDKPHLTTMHSWLGFMTVLAFVGLFSMGVVFYCTERFVGYKLRKVSVHWHKLAGISVLLLSGTAIVTGIQEAAEHHTEHPGIGYPDSAVARVGQAIGILLPFPMLAAAILLTKVDYRRRMGDQERPLASHKRKYNTNS